jgi:Galactose oxidase, central domain/Kelch motif
VKAGRWTLLAWFMVAACGSATPSASVTPLDTGNPSGELPTSAPPAVSLPPAASPIATVPATPSTTVPVSDAYGRWESAGELVRNSLTLQWPGHPLQTHVLPFGETALVVGSDNVCTPGAAWRESVQAQVWGGGGEPWQAAPTLPRARDRFGAFSLPDGPVLVVGGLTDHTGGPKSFSSTYRLEPGATEWTRSGDLNSARSGPAGTVLEDGRILVAGGWYSNMPDAPPVVVVNSAELFDPETELWSRTGSMVRARVGAGAVTLSEGRVLVAGGFGAIPSDSEGAYGFTEELASAEIFDPATGTFATTGSLPWTASWPSLVALPGGEALLVSGDRAARFDGARGQWAETPPMHLRLEDHRLGDWVRTAVGLPGGEVLVAGGTVPVDSPEEGSTKPFSNRAEVYDPMRNRWIEIAPMPVGRVGGTGVRMNDGSVLIAGGAGSVGQLGAPYCPAPAPEAVRFIPS